MPPAPGSTTNPGSAPKPASPTSPQAALT
jgi:hypothetical protein